MRVILFLALLYLSIISNASVIIVATDDTTEYAVSYDRIEIYEDPTASLTIYDIIKPAYAFAFNINEIQLPRNYNLNSAYWIRFTVKSTSVDKKWLYEYFDSSIEEIEFFIPDRNGTFKIKKAGSKYSFGSKFFQHKNYEFMLPDDLSKPTTFYARIKSSQLVFMYGVIRSIDRFTNYALTEYYFLGAFYGIIVAMAIYNLLLFMTIRDKTYLFYVLYVLSSGFLCMVMDGTGFQYLWGDHPGFNQTAFSFASFLMILWALMYTQGFVILKSTTRFHINILELIIIIRILLFIVGLKIYPDVNKYVFIDTLALFVCFVSGIISYNKGNTATRFFVLGFAFFFIGYIISNLTVNSIFGISLPNNIFTVYSYNFGIVIEMILLSYALADRVKIILKENEEAQHQAIKQLKEKDELKEKLNKELEQKVIERTAEIVKKSEQLELKNDELNRLYGEITDNIKVAKWIQESIMPSILQIQKHLPQCFVLYKPKDVVSGDFYWFEAKYNKVYIAAVDCTGHGVSGAFMSIIGYTLLNQIIRGADSDHLNAAQILDKLNEGVIDTLRQKQKDPMTRDGMDINLCIIDHKNMKLSYAGAVNYLYVIRNGELTKLVADSFSIGIPKTGDLQYFTNHDFDLQSGDLLIQYTDGYADQIGGDDAMSKFKYPKFRDLFINNHAVEMDSLKKILDDTIEKWKNKVEQTDDILVIGTRIL
ncbi:MAG: 7TM diverse intracellular signaling domain-containing protein [Cytophagales bacterium]|nr:7TM diverse intracellular signaling domain-containing protein [Cytophagales bacterium]